MNIHLTKYIKDNFNGNTYSSVQYIINEFKNFSLGDIELEDDEDQNDYLMLAFRLIIWNLSHFPPWLKFDETVIAVFEEQCVGLTYNLIDAYLADGHKFNLTDDELNKLIICLKTLMDEKIAESKKEIEPLRTDYEYDVINDMSRKANEAIEKWYEAEVDQTDKMVKIYTAINSCYMCTGLGSIRLGDKDLPCHCQDVNIEI